DLVVLASCNSSSLGVDQMLLNAGVGATVGALWPVDDAATHALMRQFYHHLAQGDDKDVALAAAQRDVLSGVIGDDRWRLPYFWGTVVLSGNWLKFALKPLLSDRIHQSR